MKIRSYEAFQQGKKKNVLCYLFVMPNNFDRRIMIDDILKNKTVDPHTLTYLSCEQHDSKRIIEALDSSTFFAKDPPIVIDNLHLLSKKDVILLMRFLQRYQIKNFLVLSSKNKLNLSTLYQWVDEKGLVFDLSYEKLWEKDKRLKTIFCERCLKEGKTISHQVLEVLFDRVGLESDLIDNEINKAIAFVGLKEVITKEDIEKICRINETNTLWQLAEKIVWQEGGLEKDIDLSIRDSSSFHQLLAAIRYQLTLGLKLSSLIENNQDIHKHLHLFPKIYPQTLEKRKKLAQKKNSTYFIRALQELFSIDLLSKSQATRYQILLDVLRGKMDYGLD